jgi:glycerol-1-phosphate dehydrogenase [NAD(P)+]
VQSAYPWVVPGWVTTPACFTHDPADMDGLRRTIAARPDASSLPRLALGRVASGPDALLRLPEVVEGVAGAGPRKILVVQDRGPFMRGGAELKPAVQAMLLEAGFDVELLELGDERFFLHSDFGEVEQVRSHLRPDRVTLALGSGKICDVTKHACFEHEQATGEHIAFVAVPTANSVVAFGSGLATIAKEGVKRTWASRLPDALILDGRTLCDAPFQYTLGGIGDLAVIAVSFADWSLGSQLGVETFVPAAFDIVTDVRALLSSQAAAFGDRSVTGMETLAKLCTLGGLAATLAGRSTPMSGYEHAVSHMLDMSAGHFDRPLASHGSQCGVSTIPCVIAWRRFLDDFDPAHIEVDACYPSLDEVERRLRPVFDEIDPSGAMAAECWSHYAQKLLDWHGARAQFEALLRDWPHRRSQLEELVAAPESVVGELVRSDHPIDFEELGVPDEQARWAFRNGDLMRNRFSLADLLNFIGWLDDAFVDDVFARMHVLVASRGSLSH